MAGKFLELRPEEVNQRIEPGHWKMDCVVGPLGTKESLLTLSERVLRYELIFKLETKTLENVANKIDNLEIKLGTNENLNREIRRYFPKGTKFKNISET